MIAFKKYQIYALFTLLLTSFAGLLQGSEESALSRGWASISHFGDKVLKHPATPYVAAPIALYTGYKLASLPIEYTRKHTLERTLSPLASYLAGGATALTYYAPTFALTELMRKQRATIPENNGRPSKWYFFGPALVQSLIIGGFLLPSAFIPKDLPGTYKGLLATLLLTSIVSPGTATGLVSCLKEWGTDWDKRIQAIRRTSQDVLNRPQTITNQVEAIQDQRQNIQTLLQRIQDLRQSIEDLSLGTQNQRQNIQALFQRIQNLRQSIGDLSLGTQNQRQIIEDLFQEIENQIRNVEAIQHNRNQASGG